MVSRKYSKCSSSKLFVADIDVEVAAPIVLDPLVDDVAARRKILDAIGAAAERRLERGVGDVALLAVLVGAFPPVFRQDGELADDLRQLAIARRVEGEGDLVLAGLLRLGDVTVIGGKLRAVFLERRRKKKSRPPASPACRHAIWLAAAADRTTEEKSAGKLTASASRPYSLDTSSSDETDSVS